MSEFLKFMLTALIVWCGAFFVSAAIVAALFYLWPGMSENQVATWTLSLTVALYVFVRVRGFI